MEHVIYFIYVKDLDKKTWSCIKPRLPFYSFFNEHNMASEVGYIKTSKTVKS